MLCPQPKHSILEPVIPIALKPLGQDSQEAGHTRGSLKRDRLGCRGWRRADDGRRGRGCGRLHDRLQGRRQDRSLRLRRRHLRRRPELDPLDQVRRELLEVRDAAHVLQKKQKRTVSTIILSSMTEV